MASKSYYVTTPIYYATDRPHIGHTYTTVAADAAARYRRLTGHDVFFLTGTDEHGQKMERAAQRAGVQPAELANQTSPRYMELWKGLCISHDRFIRTTEEAHKKAVVEVFERVRSRGDDVYEGTYRGLYCAECENYILEGGADGRCPDHDIPLEQLEEQGLFFRLSTYGPKLLEFYEKHPLAVQPQSRMNEVVSFIKEGLKDLCISRSTTRWGVAVPGKPDQVFYVWMDALVNYLTGIGLGTDQASFERYWPADVHLVGKDILRFHAIIWPAWLMAAGIELPRQVFGHGWWLQSGAKISKSKGDVVQVEPMLEALGPDAVRYFLLREVPLGLDGTYSDEAIIGRYNADLANDFGNLVSRTFKMVQRYRDGVLPAACSEEAELGATAAGAISGYREHFDVLAFSRGLESLWELVRATNRFVDERAPWKLAADPAQADALDTVLWHAAEACRLLSVALEPVTPVASGRVLAWLGVSEARRETDLDWGLLQAGTRIGAFEPLFPRADPKALASRATKPEQKSEQQQQQQPDAETGAGLLSFDDFMRVQLKTARVVEAEAVPRSKKLIRLVVDLGDEKRQIVAGIALAYKPEELLGRTLIVVTNLEPARLMGVESRGMLLAATVGDKPVLAGFDREVPPGAQVR